MPTGAVLVVRLQAAPDADSLCRWRQEILAAFDADDFYFRGPLRVVQDASDGPIPVEDGSVWLDVGTAKDYYGTGYERGDAEYFVRLAEWLERQIPGGEVWYGHDAADESIKPFGAEQREAFMQYFRTVGHEPYDSRFRSHSGPAAHNPPMQRTGAAGRLSWIRKLLRRGPGR